MTSSAPRAVRIAASPRAEKLVAVTLASLPQSFRLDPDAAEVVAVSGEPGWVERALVAIRAGARGVMVVEPELAPATGIRALIAASQSGGVAVRLGEPWVANPAVAPFAAHAREGQPVLTDSRAIARPDQNLRQVLVDQVRLVEQSLAVQISIEAMVLTASGYTASGYAREASSVSPVMLGGSLSTAMSPRAVVRELSTTGRRSIDVHDAATARPAIARVGSARGEAQLPTVHETAHRAQWRQLHSDLDRDQSEVSELDSLARTLEKLDEWIADE